MKIFGWMQNKFNGRNGNKKQDLISVTNHTRQEPCKEEFSDWPHSLLAIGTFGSNDYIEEDSKKNHIQENLTSQDHPQELTPEEVGRLQNELNLLLDRQTGPIGDTESDTANLALGNFLNSPPNYEKKRTDNNEFPEESDKKDYHFQSTSVVPSRGKDLCVDNTNKPINKRSLSFLLKKMFVCRNGFTPTPSLRDQVPESRMEKILRAVLHKKIYPQNPNPALAKKKYLENKNGSKSVNEDEKKNQKADNGSKWVKTDSEYIVLEI